MSKPKCQCKECRAVRRLSGNVIGREQAITPSNFHKLSKRKYRNEERAHRD